jgi:hypothetical protein
MRVKPEELKAMLHKRIRSPGEHAPLAHGLNAAPGAASGKVTFNIREVVRLAEKSERVILVRPYGHPGSQGLALLHTLDGSLSAGRTKSGYVVAGKVGIEGALHLKLHRQTMADPTHKPPGGPAAHGLVANQQVCRRQQRNQLAGRPTRSHQWLKGNGPGRATTMQCLERLRHAVAPPEAAHLLFKQGETGVGR